MSIESQLTILQAKVDTLIELSSTRKEGSEEDEEEWRVSKSAQAEIRTFELWRKVMAECLGTLCYVFFVCGVSIPWTGHFPPFLSVAFASALAYGALTFNVFPGAHLNPAFTLALTAIQRVSSLRCVLFITAQAGGAIAGAAILFGMSSPGYQGTLGATTIASHVEPAQAFGLELILTFVLTLTFVSDTKNCIPTTAVLLAANLVALPCTGASLNPVRSLGPAFVMNKWPKHWVFWLGPTAGALLASYLHRFILKRSKFRKVRENSSDGDSLDVPPAELPTIAPDRLLCERFEPLYGGTRSLYTKPSPVLPKSNLHRSQSVYASKRFDFPPRCADSVSSSLRKHHHQSTANTNQFHQPDSNYEQLLEQKKQGLLVSGPPSYDSAYYKIHEKPHSLGHNHAYSEHHHGHGRHAREKSDSHSYHQSRDRDSHNQQATNRILAQYETKGLVDVDPKVAIHTQGHNKQSIYLESSEIQHGGRKLVEVPEKKLIDTSSGSESGKCHNNGGSVPIPPRFRIPPQVPPPHSEHRYPPPGQCSSASSTTAEMTNDLSRTIGNGNSGHGHHKNLSPIEYKQHQQQHSVVLQARKPYEILESSKLLEFSPHESQNGHSHNSHHDYSPRLLMAEKDSTYSRILEPIMNSKPGSSSNTPHNKHHQSVRGGYGHNLSPNDHLTYSYH